MIIASFPFGMSDWSSVPVEERKGETGTVCWQVKMMNNIRVRKVEYSAGYEANHWCKNGHVLHCIAGGDIEAHRSSTTTGCKLFIVD